MPDDVAPDRRPRSPSPRPARAPSSPGDDDQPASWLVRRPLLTLSIAILLVYVRIFSAGFVAFDDDLHVYANPFLNPPTLESVARLWQHAYEQLYVPLAYTIFAAIARLAQVPAHIDSSIGHSVSLGPTAFHVVGVALHLGNAWLCFSLVRRLTGRARAALLCCAPVRAAPAAAGERRLDLRAARPDERRLRVAGAERVRPVAPDDGQPGPAPAQAPGRVGAPGELRDALQAERCRAPPGRAGDRSRRLPIALAQGAGGRVALGRGRPARSRSITRATQTVPAAGQSLWWQRPFIAGDALAFYLFKTVVPIDLCVDYGRTPHAVMSHAWGYLAWAIPVALLVLGLP